MKEHFPISCIRKPFSIMKKGSFLIFQIILLGYTTWFLFFYKGGALIFTLSRMGYANNCTQFDLALPLAFSPLLFLSLIFQLINFVTPNTKLFKNGLMMSLSVFSIWSLHELMELIFNNKSNILLNRPLLLNPFIPLVFALFIYWFTKNREFKISPKSKFLMYFISTARIIFFVIFSIFVLAILYHHSYLIYESYTKHSRFINEYNCGDYPDPPGYIPPPRHDI